MPPELETPESPAESPPPASQPVPPTDNRQVFALYDQVLAEKERERITAVRELEELKNKTNNPPDSQEVQSTRFFQKPQDEIRNLIQAELASQLAPITNLVNEIRGGNVYAQLKNSFKQQSKYKYAFDNFEAEIDAVMNTCDKTPQNMNLAIMTVLGNAQLEGRGPSSTTPLVNNRVPAQLPPRAPAPIQDNLPLLKRTFSELEKRLMRERGQTEEEYVALMDAPANIEKMNAAVAKPAGAK